MPNCSCFRARIRPQCSDWHVGGPPTLSGNIMKTVGPDLIRVPAILRSLVRLAGKCNFFRNTVVVYISSGNKNDQRQQAASSFHVARLLGSIPCGEVRPARMDNP